jgi:hypothetical protein
MVKAFQLASQHSFHLRNIVYSLFVLGEYLIYDIIIIDISSSNIITVVMIIITT